ncbi:MAG: hypothetical protein HRU38_23455 [Saccharospirillaceae bacterium]|nr:hypothetical protein [Saccharospirillaceae bacterium]
MKIEVTNYQLQAIANMANDMEAMIGNGEDGDDYGIDESPDKEWLKNIKAIDRMLKKNGYSR